MPGITTDHLFRLIKSMNKAEKRAFKLWATRTGSTSEDALFVQLFDVLDRQTHYEEEEIFQKIPSLKRSQLSNLKRHLYRQLLTSLRLLHIPRNIDIQIREEIDFAKVLYNKGLYQQSLKILDRIKEIARDNHQNMLYLEALEFEKMIESRHIAQTLDIRTDTLIAASAKGAKVVAYAVQLSNLALKMFNFYVKSGHARHENEGRYITNFFNSQLPEVNYETLGFFEKVHYCQAHVWYYYILQNFPMHYRYTQRWVDLFEEHPEMKEKDAELYLRGLHSLLTALFYTRRYEKFVQVLRNMEWFILRSAEQFDTNTEMQAFTFLYTAKINRHFLDGTFSDGLFLLPELEEKIQKYEPFLDSHRILVFYYKMACLYFGSGDFSRSIDYLNAIIHYKTGELFSDIQSYARILHLIAHFEMGHYLLLEHLVKTVYRFLSKMENLNGVQREILTFLRREINTSPHELRHAFLQLHAKLEKMSNQPAERRSFLYLDILSWLESKIQGKTVAEVIRQKFVASIA